MAESFTASRLFRIPGLVALALVCVGCSSPSNPAQPMPPAQSKALELTTDRQHLVIRSSDFVWDSRQGVTLDLTRAAWPADLECPRFRNCGSY